MKRRARRKVRRTRRNLELLFSNCTSCVLHKRRTQIVLGKGPVPCNLMLIGEAAGEEEDKQGIPFVGDAGKKLDTLLELCGFNPEEIYITNTCICRPRRNRNPKPKEMDSCWPRLKMEIEMVNPRFIILAGRVAWDNAERNQQRKVFSNYQLGYMNHPASIFYDATKEEAIIKQLKNIYRKVKAWN